MILLSYDVCVPPAASSESISALSRSRVVLAGPACSTPVSLGGGRDI